MSPPPLTNLDGLANPRPPFTPVPNDALERLAAFGLSGREFRILLVVIRKTWGWGKEKDKIPMSQFARFTGIDRRHCHSILTSLIKQKIINKTVTAYGDRKVISYSFNDVYAEWKLSPPMVTKVKGKVVTIDGNRVSPSTVTVLSPSTAHSIDKERNITKESGEEPPGLLKGQGLSPYTGTDDGMISICTHCGKKAETVRQNGELLCIHCFKKDDRLPVSQLTGGIGRHLNA